MPSQRAAAVRPADVSRSPSSRPTTTDRTPKPTMPIHSAAAKGLSSLSAGSSGSVETATDTARATGTASPTSTTLSPEDQHGPRQPAAAGRRPRPPDGTAPTSCFEVCSGPVDMARSRDPPVARLRREVTDVGEHHLLVLGELVGRPAPGARAPGRGSRRPRGRSRGDGGRRGRRAWRAPPRDRGPSRWRAGSTTAGGSSPGGSSVAGPGATRRGSSQAPSSAMSPNHRPAALAAATHMAGPRSRQRSTNPSPSASAACTPAKIIPARPFGLVRPSAPSRRPPAERAVRAREYSRSDGGRPAGARYLFRLVTRASGGIGRRAGFRCQWP